MDILFTFNVEKEQQDDFIQQFPSCTFHFKRTGSCEEAEIADVIVTYGSNVTEELLERAKNLKWVMVAAAGVEQVDLAQLKKRNILLTNARGIHKTPMGESILAHILSLTREVREVYKGQAQKEWKSSLNPNEVYGSRALILGPGSIGMEVGRLLQAFGVETVGCSRSGRQTEYMTKNVKLDALLEELPTADYVISILPSTPDTKGLLTAEHFDAMKETAIFLNFGRGDVLDEEVLLKALEEQKIHHAVLDVFQEEPLPENSPFWTLNNCTVSPHISAKSDQYVPRALEIFKNNLEKYVQGEKELDNLVDLTLGY